MPVFRSPTLLAILATFGLGSALVAADVPGLLPYQGRVQENGVNLTGSARFKFSIVDGENQILWQNDVNSSGNQGTAGVRSKTRAFGNPEPTNAVTLTVINGIFNILLGDTTQANMSALPPEVFDNNGVSLRVWVNSTGSGAFTEITPAIRLAASPYAMRAASAGFADVALNAETANTATNAVTANTATTALSVADGSVGIDQLNAIGRTTSDQVLTATATGGLAWTDKASGGIAGRGPSWLSGRGDPGEFFASSGQEGDLYLDTDFGGVYKRTGESWIRVITTLFGTNGPKGDIGTPGSKWFVDAGNPTDPANTALATTLSLAIVGDFYLDRAASLIYERKDEGESGINWVESGNVGNPLSLPIGVNQGGTGANNLPDARTNLGIPQNNVSEDSDPSESDNSNSNFRIGSLWVNHHTGDIFINQGERSASEGGSLLAEWRKISNTGITSSVLPPLLSEGGTADQTIPVTEVGTGQINRDFVPVMVGATGGVEGGTDGKKGLVPVPQAGDANKFLRGDGRWAITNHIQITKLTPTRPFDFYEATTSDELIVIDANPSGRAGPSTGGETTPEPNSSLINLPTSDATNKGQVIRIKTGKSPNHIVHLAANVHGQKINDIQCGPGDSILHVDFDASLSITMVSGGDGSWYSLDANQTSVILRPTVGLSIGNQTTPNPIGQSSAIVDGQERIFLTFSFEKPSGFDATFVQASQAEAKVVFVPDPEISSDYQITPHNIDFFDPITGACKFSSSSYFEINAIDPLVLVGTERIDVSLVPIPDVSDFTLNSSYYTVHFNLQAPPKPNISIIPPLASGFQESALLSPEPLCDIRISQNGRFAALEYVIQLTGQATGSFRPLNNYALSSSVGFVESIPESPGFFLLKMPSTTSYVSFVSLSFAATDDDTKQDPETITLTILPSISYIVPGPGPGRSTSFTVSDFVAR